MSLVNFDIAQLPNLGNGIVAEAFNIAVKQAAADCEDRPVEQRARKVILEMSIVPVVAQGSFCTGAEAEFQVKTSLPTRKSQTYSFAVRRTRDGHQLIFNDASPDNVNQRTIDQAIDG